MSAWLQQLVLGSLGLAIIVLLAGAVLRLWRREPLDSYRFAVGILAVTLGISVAQWGVQASGWGAGDTLIGRWGEQATEWLRADRWWVSADPTEAARAGESSGHPPVQGRLASLAPVEGSATVTRFGDALDGEEALGFLLVPAGGASLAQGSPSAGDRPAEVAAPHAGSLGWRTIAALLGVYSIGVVVALVRTGLRLRRTRRLLRSSEPVSDPRVQETWARVLAASPLRDEVELRTTPEIRVPMCFGLGTPTVLIPAEDDASLDADLLACVLLHELVHLERGDTWVMLGQELVRSLFWFHPAAWWLCTRIDLLRELSCDLLVVRRTGRRKRYATALVEYAAHVRRELGPSPAPSTALLPWSSSNNQLSRRIEMLVNQSKSRSRNARRAVCLATGSLFSLLYGGQLALAAAVSGPQETEVVEVTPAAEETELAELIELLSRDVAEAPSSGTLTGSEPQDESPLTLRRDGDDGPMIGVRIGSTKGGKLVIDEVIDGSIAEAAGLRDGDTIVRIDGERAEWKRLLEAKKGLGKRAIELQVEREGEVLVIELHGGAKRGNHLFGVRGGKAGGVFRLKQDGDSDPIVVELKELKKSLEKLEGLKKLDLGKLELKGLDELPFGTLDLDDLDLDVPFELNIEGPDAITIDGERLELIAPKIVTELKQEGVDAEKIQAVIERIQDSSQKQKHKVHVITKQLLKKLKEKHGEGGAFTIDGDGHALYLKGGAGSVLELDGNDVLFSDDEEHGNALFFSEDGGGEAFFHDHGEGEGHAFFRSDGGDDAAGGGVFWRSQDDGGTSKFYTRGINVTPHGDGEKGQHSFKFKVKRRDGDAGEFFFDSTGSGSPHLELKGSLQEATEALERAMKEHPEHAEGLRRALESLRNVRGPSFLHRKHPRGFDVRIGDGEQGANPLQSDHGDAHDHADHPHPEHGDHDLHGIQGQLKRRDVRLEGELEKMRALIRKRQEELERLERRLEELRSRSGNRLHGGQAFLRAPGLPRAPSTLQSGIALGVPPQRPVAPVLTPLGGDGAAVQGTRPRIPGSGASLR